MPRLAVGGRKIDGTYSFDGEFIIARPRGLPPVNEHRQVAPACPKSAAKPPFEKTCRCGLQIGQSALSGETDQLGIRSHAGLRLDEIVIILHGLHAEVEA